MELCLAGPDELKKLNHNPLRRANTNSVAPAGSGTSMSGKLLLRFDDICPTMNWRAWREIEQALYDTGIKPLLAVIPDNRDPAFHLANPRRDFWDHVRRWHSLGWMIGMHGYQHSYATRCPGLLGINSASEFAGLTARQQETKIKLGLEIFRREGLEPSVWVAPGHSFDRITLQVLSEVGLNVVSDGFSCFPYRDRRGIFWVPQQMWRFRPVPFGVWTICIHHNFWGPGAINRFQSQIAKYHDQISSFEQIMHCYRGRARSVLDTLSSFTLGSVLSLKRALRKGTQQ